MEGGNNYDQGYQQQQYPNPGNDMNQYNSATVIDAEGNGQNIQNYPYMNQPQYGQGYVQPQMTGINDPGYGSQDYPAYPNVGQGQTPQASASPAAHDPNLMQNMGKLSSTIEKDLGVGFNRVVSGTFGKIYSKQTKVLSEAEFTAEVKEVKKKTFRALAIAVIIAFFTCGAMFAIFCPVCVPRQGPIVWNFDWSVQK